MRKRKPVQHDWTYTAYVVGTGQMSVIDTVTATTEADARAQAEVRLSKLEPTHLLADIKQNP